MTLTPQQLDTIALLIARGYGDFTPFDPRALFGCYTNCPEYQGVLSLVSARLAEHFQDWTEKGTVDMYVLKPEALKAYKEQTTR